MVTDYSFKKAKIPKGMSFPLKRSRLDAALLESGVEGIHFVYYRMWQSGNFVLHGDFCGEQRRAWAAAGLSTITIYAVPSSERHAVETALETELLPKLMRWLLLLQKAGNTGRAADRHFIASWCNGVTSVETF
jgi:hypothetical protein